MAEKWTSSNPNPKSPMGRALARSQAALDRRNRLKDQHSALNHELTQIGYQQTTFNSSTPVEEIIRLNTRYPAVRQLMQIVEREVKDAEFAWEQARSDAEHKRSKAVDLEGQIQKYKAGTGQVRAWYEVGPNPVPPELYRWLDEIITNEVTE